MQRGGGESPDAQIPNMGYWQKGGGDRVKRDSLGLCVCNCGLLSEPTDCVRVMGQCDASKAVQNYVSFPAILADRTVNFCLLEECL